MLKNFKISIITVAYNAEGTIEQTINSVLNQTYSNIEYIVIDGGSTDRTVDIIEKYDSFISFWISEPDQGIYYAMNKGIEMATGEIIGIINADDWYEKNALDIIVNVFNDAEVEIVYGKLNIVENDKVVRSTYPLPLNNMWFRMAIDHPATFVKRSVYERLGLFDTSYMLAADYDFLLKAYCEGVKFQYIDSTIANFRNDGVSSTKLVECAEETVRVTLRYIDRCPNKELVYLKNEERLYTTKFNELFKMKPQLIRQAIYDYFGEEITTVSIIGTGVWGKDIVDILSKCEIGVEACYDNESSKWGKEFNHLKILNPIQLRDKKADVIVAIKSNTEEIERQFKEYANFRLKWIMMYDLMKKVVDDYYDKTDTYSKNIH